MKLTVRQRLLPRRQLWHPVLTPFLTILLVSRAVHRLLELACSGFYTTYFYEMLFRGFDRYLLSGSRLVQTLVPPAYMRMTANRQQPHLANGMRPCACAGLQ